MVLTLGVRSLEQEQGVRAKLPAVKTSARHLIAVICGPAFLTRDGGGRSSRSR
jgi:hypothetical protein